MKQILAWALPLVCALGAQVRAGDGAADTAGAFPPAVVAADAAPMASDLAADGTVRVIVELALPARMASPPDERALAARRRAVAAAQERVLARIFGGSGQASRAGGFERGLRQYEISPMFAITVDGEELDRLARDPDVSRIHLDRLNKPLLQNSVPQVGMDGAGGAYALGATGEGQAVAVLDTGVQVSHPFLSGKTIAEACFSNASGSGISLCPNGTRTQTGPGAAEATTARCVNGPENLCTHGTHVAGIAVGRNPAPGIPPNGVAKAARLIAVQVFTRFDRAAACGDADMTPCVMSYTSDDLAALEWVYANRASLAGGARLAAVNMSLGGGSFAAPCDDNPLKPIIDSLRAANVATVIASGNDAYLASVGAPGCISTAVTVGATTRDDRIAYFSNESQTLVDLLAPGVDILSSVPVSQYAGYSGTSMATPHVAGAFAAIRSRLPSLPVAQIENALKGTGVPVPSYAGTYATPRILVSAALDALGLTQWTLTVAVAGSGTVTSSPAGIACGSACSARYDNGARVTLSQTAARGYRFSGWGGACAGTGACTVVMDAQRSVTAGFVALPRYPLTVTRPTGGVVGSEPAGILCGGRQRQCTASFAQVRLVATPDAGYQLVRWRGCPDPEGHVCELTLTAATTLKPVFGKLPRYTLRIAKNRLGAIVGSPAGLDCPDRKKTCAAKFFKGTDVTLSPVPQSGHAFAGWTGACSGTQPCRLTMDADTRVGAVFQ